MIRSNPASTRPDGQLWVSLGLLLTALGGVAASQRADAQVEGPVDTRVGIGQVARPGEAASPAPAAAGSDEIDVTTDSAEYCQRLRAKLDAYVNPPRIVQELRVEGEEMCHAGRFRGGIARLRRALLAMRDAEH